MQAHAISHVICLQNPVPCPTCKGLGKVKRGGRAVRCLACVATGKVEAYRVCATCHEWAQSCTCRWNLASLIDLVEVPKPKGRQKPRV